MIAFKLAFLAAVGWSLGRFAGELIGGFIGGLMPKSKRK